MSDVFPKHAVASVVGLGGLAGAAGGMMFPFIGGKLLVVYRQRKRNRRYTVGFAICAFAYLVTFGIHHLRHPSFETFKMDSGVGKILNKYKLNMMLV